MPMSDTAEETANGCEVPNPHHYRAAQLRDLIENRNEYLLLCQGEEDFHSVADAAADLREFRVELKLQQELAEMFAETLRLQTEVQTAQLQRNAHRDALHAENAASQALAKELQARTDVIDSFEDVLDPERKTDEPHIDTLRRLLTE